MSQSCYNEPPWQQKTAKSYSKNRKICNFAEDSTPNMSIFHA